MTATPNEMWQELHDGLRGFIAKRVGNSAEVDDLLQEVFLRMHQSIESVKDRGRLVSWVYQITRHVIVDHYRGTERRREIAVGDASDVETAGAYPATTLVEEDGIGQERAELARCLRPMLEQLGEDYRVALRLVELEGLTQQEAAKRVGLTTSGMKSRVQRGRQQLRRLLDECCVIQLDARRAIASHAVRDRKRCRC